MSEDDRSAELEQRLGRLEQRVAELEIRSSAAASAPAPLSPTLARVLAAAPRATTDAPPPRPAPQPAAAPSTDRWYELGEGWLGRAGIGLVVVSLILLYRYAVDQGWLTPQLRIGIGLLIGSGLLLAGLRFFPERRVYRQILMGGGIIALFITGLAASELYHLISGTGALAFHTLVGALAFVIAYRQDDSVMASIGAAGSLLPPGILLADSVPGTMLWLHLLLIIVWTGLMYATTGWVTLLRVAALSGVIATVHNVEEPGALAVRIIAAGVLAAAWLSYAVLPLARSAMPLAANRGKDEASPALQYGLAMLVPLGLAVAADSAIFGGARTFGLTNAIAAAGFFLVAGALGTQRRDAFATALFAATFCTAVATLSGIDAPWNFAALSAVGAAAVWLSAGFAQPVALGRGHAVPMLVLAHLSFGFLALAIFAEYELLASRPLFDSYALAFIAATAAAAWSATKLATREASRVYWAGVYVAGHLLLASELGHVEGASWLASSAYAVVGGALVLYGLSHERPMLQRAGLLSLALLVGRLFLIDLAKVGVGVRIVLFMGCGFAFLALSYFFRARKKAA